MKKYQVYRIDDMETGHYYIGMHRGDIFSDDYWGSGSGIKEHMRARGRNGLHRSILHEFTNEDACATMEAELVTWDTVSDPLCLNRQPGGFYSGPMSEESRQRLSESRKGHNPSQEARESMRMAQLGRKQTEETKAKLRNIRLGKLNPMYGVSGENSPTYGRTHSEEAKKKIREFRFGKTLSDEVKAKISESKRGKGRKITTSIARTIKKRLAEEKKVYGLYARIASEFRVNASLIYDIARGKTWRHVL